MGLLGDLGRGFLAGGIPGAVGNAVTGGKITGALTGDPAGDAEKKRRELLYQQARLANAAAGQAQRGYRTLGARGTGALDDLQAQAQGRNSYSAEQLRQGLQQQQAAAQSFAAGASPRNAAGAARTAAIQMGRNQAGLAGQQALAGIQERNQAQMAYGNLLQGLRGQDAQMALGSRGQALDAYSPQQVGVPDKSFLEKYGPAIMTGAQLVASDERLKTDIKRGDKHIERAMAKLSPHTYRYKDERHGAGTQTGIMAQDLERAGLGHAVINTPGGKMVHGAKLAGSIAAMMPNLHKRLMKLENKR